jgi:hypothetical protein
MVLSIEQYGFRIGLKTGNAIYKLTSEILNAMNNKLLVEGIIYGLEKAFCIDHGFPLSKFNSHDIMARIMHFISFIWTIGIIEQQCTKTMITVIKYQAWPKPDV